MKGSFAEQSFCDTSVSSKKLDSKLDDQLTVTSFDLTASMASDSNASAKKAKKKKRKSDSPAVQSVVLSDTLDRDSGVCDTSTPVSATGSAESVAVAVSNAKLKRKDKLKQSLDISGISEAETTPLRDVMSVSSTSQLANDSLKTSTKKKKKKSKLSNDGGELHVTTFDLTGVKKEDNDSVGSFDSGLGLLAPTDVLKTSPVKKSKKSKHKSLATGTRAAELVALGASTSLPLLDVTPSEGQGESSSVRKNKLKLKKKSRHSIASANVDFSSTASTKAQCSAAGAALVDSTDTHGESVATASTKKRKRQSSVSLAVDDVAEAAETGGASAADGAITPKKKKSKHKQ